MFSTNTLTLLVIYCTIPLSVFLFPFEGLVVTSRASYSFLLHIGTLALLEFPSGPEASCYTTSPWQLMAWRTFL